MASRRLGGLAQQLTIATAGLTGPEAQRTLATFARSERDKVVAAKRARNGSEPQYTTAVNGRIGATEDSVKLPGPIVYIFDNETEIAAYLVDFLKQRAPKDTGRFASRFRYIQNGSYVSAHQLKAGVEFYVTNPEPYSRKIEVGHMRMSVPHHVFEDARQAAQSRFGNTTKFRVHWLELANGYILKGHFRRGAGKHARTKLRADTSAGARMTYPAILVTPL